jgi:hypothetical protein
LIPIRKGDLKKKRGGERKKNKETGWEDKNKERCYAVIPIGDHGVCPIGHWSPPTI